MGAPKRAMVLAAGLGKRMLPVSATTPKPLVEVGGKALIDHCLDGLAEAGVELAVVNIHHLADSIVAHLAGRRAPRIVISDERGLLLETGGGVRKALPLLGDEPFLLRNSDSFWIEGARPNLRWLVSGWDSGRMDVLLLLASTVRSVGYAGRGDFFLGKDGELTRRAERTVAPFAYAGAAILHPRLFDGAPDGAFSLNLLFDRAIEAKKMFGVRMDGLWINVETPAAVALAEQAIAASAA
ncbi:MAG TPA: nucleotidyltransferase family protein [Propylenella sp.]|nr:nucleotidyltransferase family protein [Propylenella sp.]